MYSSLVNIFDIVWSDFPKFCRTFFCALSIAVQLLNQVIEQELVLRNLLGKFLPLLSYMVANEQKKFSHPLLRETSILALCR